MDLENILPNNGPSIEEVKKYYGFENTSKLHQTPPKLHQNPPNIPPKFSTKKHQNPPKLKKSSTKKHQNPPKSQVINECPYCYKTFSRSDSLTRHYGRCKIKKNENKNDKQEIKELKEIVEKLLIENLISLLKEKNKGLLLEEQ